ncbi:MAG: CCA tRNA nucleotidyltransferase [Pseudomonadota bacterium]
MKVTGDWIDAPSSQAALTMLTGAGHAAFFVGGCVRNGLMDHPVSDIDIATDALPDEVIKIAAAAGQRAVPTGIEHGTITVVVDDVPHEVTTFRKDVATDGRRATVAFSKNIADDARRRDFTMNALYADAGGAVMDPLGGIEDLHARRVRFIEDAPTRIKEDYLRILRFFRFHAWFGDANEGLDAEGLAACAALSDGLEQLSKERIGAEMTKLLSAPDPAPSVAAMRSAGVLAQVLPGAEDRLLAALVHLEDVQPPNFLRRLAILGGQQVDEHLRLSKADTRRLSVLTHEMAEMTTAKELGYRHGVALGTDILLLRAVMSNHVVSQEDRKHLVVGEAATFPISAGDLMPHYEGPALGQKLKDLEQLWIASGFTLTKSDMLS